MLRTALRSPAEYHARYVAKTLADEPGRSQLLGSAVHTLVLEPGEYDKLYYVRPDGIDGRTREGKAALADLALRSVGKTELKADLDRQARAMAAAVLRESLVKALLAGAVYERAVVWSEVGLEFKCRPDVFVARPDEPSDLILDLKTSEDSTPEFWNRSGAFGPMVRYNYNMQAAHYARGIGELTGRPCSCGLIVVGVDSPHDVYVYDITDWLPSGDFYRRTAIAAIQRGCAESFWRRPEQGQVIRLAAPYHTME